MILKRLVELADRLDDLPPPGYGRAFVTKVIRLRGDGTLRDVIPEAGEKRGKREGREHFVPREQPQRTVAVVPRLIADSANYALGKEREKDRPEQAASRHAAFRALVAECAEATGEPSVTAIRRWIESGGPEALRNDPRIAEDDDLLFEVDGTCPTELPAVRDFWVNRGKTGHEAVCLVTGQCGPVVDRMPAPIKGIPGGQPTGTAFISVNNPAGESYGLTAALNSPIGKAAAEKIGNALNYLLASDRHRLRVASAVYVYWTRRSDEEFDLFELLNNPRPEDVGQLLSSPRQGREAAPVEEADFFVLSLSANVSRIVVRDYHETTLGAVKRNLKRWFEGLSIVGPDGSAAKPMRLRSLAESMYRKAEDVPAHVPTSLVASAIAGTRLPTSLLALAIKRNIAMQGPYAEFNRQRYLSVERLALIKAVLEQEGATDLSALNVNHSDPAYHCGRLLAVLESIQRAAQGDINATLVDRYYGAACTSPGTILGNLVNDAQSHLSKLRRGGGDGWAQNRLGEVLGSIGDAFPKTLSLQRQGLFALGFYHQKAHDRQSAIDNKATKAAKETARGDEA